ncbi:MAG: TonB-dependent receptor [Reichenbachiella sp.]
MRLSTVLIIFFAFLTSTIVYGQVTIKGQVKSNENGETLPGVTVSIKGKTEGTVTDLDGNYQLSVPEGTTLVYRFLGFDTQEIKVGNRAIINVELVVSVNSLDEVVVVAYGEVKKKDITGAVSIVKGEEMMKTASTSLDQALQGRAAGVQVSQVSGKPGGQTSIRIRGSSSISAGNEPLYVIDGMLISSNNADLDAGGTYGGSMNALATINPSDIESIQILKDASATALYGSRGANGVVLITTKRGSAGKMSINIDSYYGIQSVPETLELLNGTEFANYMNDLSDEKGLPQDPTYIIPEDFGEGTNWQDAVFRDAPMQSHQITISGGDELTRFAIGGGYFKQDGIVLNSDFERATFRTSLDREVNKRMNIGANVNLSHIVTHGVLTGALSPGTGVLLPGSITSALLFPPTQPVLDPNVVGGYTFEDERNRNLPNPVADAQESDNFTQNNRVIGSLFTDIEIIDGLVFKLNLGIDAFSVKDNRFVPNYLKRTEPNNGDAVIATVDGMTWLTEYTLNYKKEITDGHTLDALIGYTRQGYKSERLNAFSLDFTDNRIGYHNLAAGLNPQPPSSGETQWGMIGYLARVNYNINSKYLVTLNMRVDGSSRFGEDTKYGYFPSAAFAWNILDETFMSSIGFFDQLKLRTSWGVIGNSEIGSYASLATVGPNGEGTFNNNEPYVGVGPLRLPNPDLRWEQTSTLNFGFDIAVLETRLMITAEYYIQNTSDLLLYSPVPTTTGFSNYYNNVASLKNQGIELSVDGVILNKGPLSWNATFNISSNKNEILELPDGVDIPVPGVLLVPSGWSIMREGESLGTFFGYQSDGIFQSDQEAQNSPLLIGQDAVAGERRYLDINGRDENGELTGEPDGVINSDDRTILGQAQPKFTWNLINNFEFKGIDFSFFIQASHGNSIVNAYDFELATLTGETNVYRDAYLNRWTPENPSNEYRKLDPSDRNIFSSAQVEDGSFIRLKNVSLGYSFPQDLLDKIKLSKLRIYASANNLYTFTDYSGYDPEVNAFGQNSLLLGIDYGGYPLSRTFIAGVQIGI